MLSYKVKVRKGRANLWGNPQITKVFDTDLILFFRVDENGDGIQFGYKKKDDPEVSCGTLEPGESFAITLEKVLVVYADCAGDTFLDCAILASAD